MVAFARRFCYLGSSRLDFGVNSDKRIDQSPNGFRADDAAGVDRDPLCRFRSEYQFGERSIVNGGFRRLEKFLRAERSGLSG